MASDTISVFLSAQIGPGVTWPGQGLFQPQLFAGLAS
jgi:hypothetical protein